MDGLENLNIQEIVEIAGRRKTKHSNSKIFKHLLLCLKAGKHEHMLKFSNKEKTEFEVTFINKKSRNWDRRDISLFEELDGIFEDRKRSKKKYEEETKTRFRSNMTKLKKYLKRIRSDKEVDNKTIKKEVYEIIYPEYLAEIRSNNRNAELNDISVINGNGNDMINAYQMGNILNALECIDPNVVYQHLNVSSVFQTDVGITENNFEEEISNMNENGNSIFNMYGENTNALYEENTNAFNLYEENTNAFNLHEENTNAFDLYEENRDALNKHTVITDVFYNVGDEYLNTDVDITEEEEISNANMHANGDVLSGMFTGENVSNSFTTLDSSALDADVGVTENNFEEKISDADVGVTENNFEEKISDAGRGVTENNFEEKIPDALEEVLRDFESGDSNWLTKYDRIRLEEQD